MAMARARPPPYRKAMSSAPQTSASSAGIPPTMTVAASASWRWTPTRSPFWVPPHRPSRSANRRLPQTIRLHVNRCRWRTTRRWLWDRTCLPATRPARLHPSSASRRSPPRVTTARARPFSGTPTAMAPVPPRPCRKVMSSARQTLASSAGIPPTTTVAASASWRWMPTGIPFWGRRNRPSRCTNLPPPRSTRLIRSFAPWPTSRRPPSRKAPLPARTRTTSRLPSASRPLSPAAMTVQARPCNCGVTVRPRPSRSARPSPPRTSAS